MKTRVLFPLFIACSILGTASAAPLFPDVNDSHWAASAVQKLTAAGLLEGYPDGTFKGDRAMSRWEVAMLLARALQKQEQWQSLALTKEELAEMQRLLAAYKDELDALGVRVTNLELQTDLLDKRVTDLERLRWWGSLEARVLTQAFFNRGGADNDAGRGGTGSKAGVPFVNYDTIVGTGPGATMRPQTHGVLPVVDYRNGKALTNGIGFTALARLGLEIKIDSDNLAGIELAAYTAQGSTPIDAYWGVTAPYLANPSVASFAAGASNQSGNNSPYSRAVLDKAWFENKPGKFKIILGTFDPLRQDGFIYAGVPNLGVYGPARLQGYGLQIQGQWDTAPDQVLRYEAYGSKFGDGNIYQNTAYTHEVYGADLSYKWGRADLKLGYNRFLDDTVDGGALAAGLFTATNVAYGNSTGWTPTQWVNPPGYLALQRTALQQSQTGAVVNGTFQSSPFDTRPIAGWNGSADNALGIKTGGGNFGPQGEDTYGLSAHYWLPMGEAEGKDGLRFSGEYGHSVYQANRLSGYQSNGNMGRLEINGIFFDGDLNFAIQGLRVDPNFNPALFAGNIDGARFIRNFNTVGRFHIHDNGNYPHNREGFGLRGTYSFLDHHATLGWKANFFQQTQTSLYDVRVPGSGLALGIPSNDVIGYAPGFIDAVFSGFAHPAIYGPQSANSFGANLMPLENPRGREQDYGINFGYHFDDPDIKLDLAYEHNNYRRDSILGPALGGSQNEVNLKSDYGLLGASWKFTPKWTLRAGSEFVRLRGHFDPAGLYNGYALATGSTNFTNIDSIQTIPFVGLDTQLSKTTSMSVDFRYYNTRDHVDPGVFAGSGPGAIGATANPFNWRGPQLSGVYKMTF